MQEARRDTLARQRREQMCHVPAVNLTLPSQAPTVPTQTRSWPLVACVAANQWLHTLNDLESDLIPHRLETPGVEFVAGEKLVIW